MDNDITLNLDLGHGQEVDLDLNLELGGGQDLTFGDLGNTDTGGGGNFDFDFTIWDPLDAVNENSPDGNQAEHDFNAFNWDLGNTSTALDPDAKAVTKPDIDELLAALAPGPAPDPTSPPPTTSNIAPNSSLSPTIAELASAPRIEPEAAVESASQPEASSSVAPQAPIPSPAQEISTGLALPSSELVTPLAPRKAKSVAETATEPASLPEASSASGHPPSAPSLAPEATARSLSRSDNVATPSASRREANAAERPASQSRHRSSNAHLASARSLRHKSSNPAPSLAGKSATPLAPRKANFGPHAAVKAAVNSTRRPTFVPASSGDKPKPSRKAKSAHRSSSLQAPANPTSGSTAQQEGVVSLFIPDPEGEKEKLDRIKQETAVLERLFQVAYKAEDPPTVESAVTRPSAARQPGAAHFPTPHPASASSPARPSPTPPPPQLTTLTGPPFRPFAKKRKRVSSSHSPPATKSARVGVKKYLPVTKAPKGRVPSTIPATKSPPATETMAQPQQRPDSPSSAPDSRSSTPRPTSITDRILDQHFKNRASLALPPSNDGRSDDDREPPRRNAVASNSPDARPQGGRPPANRFPALRPTFKPASRPATPAAHGPATASNDAQVSREVTASQQTPAPGVGGRGMVERRTLTPNIMNNQFAQQYHKPSPARESIRGMPFSTAAVNGRSEQAPPLFSRGTSLKPTGGSRDSQRQDSLGPDSLRPTPAFSIKNRRLTWAGASAVAAAKSADAKPPDSVGTPARSFAARKSADVLSDSTQRDSHNIDQRHSTAPPRPASNGGSRTTAANGALLRAETQAGTIIDRSTPNQDAARDSSPLAPASGARTPPLKNFAPKSHAQSDEQRAQRGTPTRNLVSTADNDSTRYRQEILRGIPPSYVHRWQSKAKSAMESEAAGPHTRANPPISQQASHSMRNIFHVPPEDVEAASILARASRPRWESPGEQEVVMSDESSPPNQSKRHTGLPPQEKMAQDLARQPGTHRRDSRATAAVPDIHIPPIEYLVHAAIQHLNNLTLAFKLHEEEAHEREDHLAALHMQAQDMRVDAMAWRRAAMPVIMERRERLTRLVGLADREVMQVDDWQELLRPLSE